MQKNHLSFSFPQLDFRFLSYTILVSTLLTSPAALLLQITLGLFSEVMGDTGGQSWCSAVSLSPLPVAHFFPVLWCGPSLGYSPFGHISAPVWSTSCCSLLFPPPPSLPPPPFSLGFSHQVFFFSFLNVSPKVSPSWVMDSAVSCSEPIGELAGPDCVRHRAAPGLFSPRYPLRPTH